MRIRIFEMSYDRPEIKRAIDSHLFEAVRNWCLLWVARKYPERYREPVVHWAQELEAQLEPGLDKIATTRMRSSAIKTLLDEVFLKKAEVNRPEVVVKRIYPKFKKEGLSLSDALAAAEAWSRWGIPQLYGVYEGVIDEADYEAENADIAISMER